MMEGSPTIEFKRAYNRERAWIAQRAKRAEEWIDPVLVAEWQVQEERQALARCAKEYLGVDEEEALRGMVQHGE